MWALRSIAVVLLQTCPMRQDAADGAALAALTSHVNSWDATLQNARRSHLPSLTPLSLETFKQPQRLLCASHWALVFRSTAPKAASHLLISSTWA